MQKNIIRNSSLGPWTECFKMQGSGNDFVLLDNRSLQLAHSQMAHWARIICRKAFGVGADGLIFLDHRADDPSVDYFWHFFNADGSRAEMCGNGARCAARLAFELGMADKVHVLGTDAGPIKAEVFPDQDTAKVQLTSFHSVRLHLRLHVHDHTWEAHFVNTGVPHLVIFVPDVASVDIRELGPRFRHHVDFEPAGTNVNFVQVVDKKRLLLRTFERGVEAETLACGTGAAASALIAATLNHTENVVELQTSGQERLGVTIENNVLYLTGKAILVFVAQMNLRALGLTQTWS